MDSGYAAERRRHGACHSPVRCFVAVAAARGLRDWGAFARTDHARRTTRASAMSKNETLKHYFVRARGDAAFRSEFMATTKLVRAAFGGASVLFAVLALGTSIYLRLSAGVWMSSTAALCAVCAVVNFLLCDKMGERMAALASLEETPGHAGDRAPDPRDSAAGREPRLP